MKRLLHSTLYRNVRSNNRSLSNAFDRKRAISRPTFEYVEDVEDLTCYGFGGYHPVKIGDCYRDRYRISHKLGYGACSTIWLARDLQLRKYVALKIGIADWEANEADILTGLTEEAPILRSPFIPSLLDQFSLTGPNGVHKCLVLEAARCSLAASKEASRKRLFPLGTARMLSAQLAIVVNQIHSKGYVHSDLHLGNILLKLPSSIATLSEKQLYSRFGRPVAQAVVREDKASLPSNVPAYVYEPIWLGMPTEDLAGSDANLMLADFGLAFRPSHESIPQSHTPIHVRPPESRFEPNTPLTFASDIWSLACAIWDMMAQRPLFGEILATPDMITSQQVNALGVLPANWWDKWDAKSYFFAPDGTPFESRRTPSWHDRFERDIQEPRQFLPLCFDQCWPANRPTAEAILTSEWMKAYAIPEYERGSNSAKIILAGMDT